MEIVLILLFLSSQNAVFGGEVRSTETPNSNMAEKIEALEDDWNTKFEELNGRVDKLENRIGELEEENTDLKQTLEASKLEMNTLKQGLEANDTEIERLTEEVNELNETIVIQNEILDGHINTPARLAHKDSLISGDCYRDQDQDQGSGRIFSIKAGDYIRNQKSICINHCAGYAFAGVQYRTECYCGDNEPPSSRLRPAAECYMVCPGNAEEKCGGSYRMNIYRTA